MKYITKADRIDRSKEQDGTGFSTKHYVVAIIGNLIYQKIPFSTIDVYKIAKQTYCKRAKYDKIYNMTMITMNLCLHRHKINWSKKDIWFKKHIDLKPDNDFVAKHSDCEYYVCFCPRSFEAKNYNKNWLEEYLKEHSMYDLFGGYDALLIKNSCEEGKNRYYDVDWIHRLLENPKKIAKNNQKYNVKELQNIVCNNLQIPEIN